MRVDNSLALVWPETYALSSALSAMAAVQACISDVRSWLIFNRLLINDSKTEFLDVGFRHQLSKIVIDSILVGDSTIHPEQCSKLGFLV